eukprot:gene12166-10488_t
MAEHYDSQFRQVIRRAVEVDEAEQAAEQEQAAHDLGADDGGDG